MKLSDFYTKNLHETPSTMPLLMGGEETGCYLLVTGIEAKSVAQYRLESQVAYGRMSEHTETIKDKYERMVYERDSTEEIQNQLAEKLIVDWSFDETCTEDGKMELLRQNSGLCSAVIAHASTAEEYFAKKHVSS